MGDIEGYDILYSSGFIGQGSYGSVYKARNRETGEFAAVKRIIIPSHDFESRLKSVRNEIKYVKQLGDKHKHILKLIRHQEEEDGPRLYFQILTEYCTLRDLEYYALRYFLTIRHRLKIMHQAASGLAFMHSQKPPVIHRDIKPSNILMTEENGEHVVRLADFGLARPLEGSRSHDTMTNAGTENYMAPEQFDETDFWFKLRAQFSKSGAQDAYAFGVLCYQLLQSEILKGIECPEVTKIIIGKKMMRIGEVEAEVDRSREEREQSMSWLARKMESKKEKEEKDDKRREDIWKIRNLAQSMDSDVTKYWNPIVIKDSDSDTITATKEVIKTVVKFDPRERSSMADVERRLEEIINNQPQMPGLPALMDDLPKELLPVSMEDIPTAMIKVFTYKLVTSWFIGLSHRGVITDNLRNNHLTLFSLTESGYSEVWRKPPRDGIKANSHKYILNNGNIVFRYQYDKSPTVVCDGNLNVIHTHNDSSDYDWLCGIVQADKLMYSKKFGNDRVLDLYECNSHHHVCQLPVSVRSTYVCTASHPATGWFIVTDHNCYTMYLFTSDYQLHMQVDLGFQPWHTNGVCCVGNLIAVVHYDGILYGNGLITFYNWAGQEVKVVGMEEMGVEGEILGVGDGGEGRIQVYSEDGYLHLFKI